MRGKPVSELSVGMMLDGLFAITRDFDMQTQPHLLLLQKTMVMVEGIATQLHPEINMWDVSAPYVRGWIRDELGPEAALADRIRTDLETLLRLPALVPRDEALERIRGRAYSTFDLLSDGEYAEGLARAEAELPDPLAYELDWLVVSAGTRPA